MSHEDDMVLPNSSPPNKRLQPLSLINENPLSMDPMARDTDSQQTIRGQSANGEGEHRQMGHEQSPSFGKGLELLLERHGRSLEYSRRNSHASSRAPSQSGSEYDVADPDDPKQRVNPRGRPSLSRVASTRNFHKPTQSSMLKEREKLEISSPIMKNESPIATPDREIPHQHFYSAQTLLHRSSNVSRQSTRSSGKRRPPGLDVSRSNGAQHEDGCSPLSSGIWRRETNNRTLSASGTPTKKSVLGDRSESSVNARAHPNSSVCDELQLELVKLKKDIQAKEVRLDRRAIEIKQLKGKLQEAEEMIEEVMKTQAAKQEKWDEITAKSDRRMEELEKKLRKAQEHENYVENAIVESGTVDEFKNLKRDLESAVQDKEALGKRESELMKQIKQLDVQIQEKDASILEERHHNEAAQETIKREMKDRLQDELTKQHEEEVQKHISAIGHLQTDLNVIRDMFNNSAVSVQDVTGVLMSGPESNMEHIDSLRATMRELLHRYAETNERLTAQRALSADDYLKWEPLHNLQNKRYDKLKTAHEKLKIEAKTLFEGWPELERENEQLKESLTAHRNHHSLTRSKLQKQREAAKHWEFEYRDKVEKCEQQRLGMEEEIHNLKQDMIHCIEEYQDSPPRNSPDFNELKYLTEKILDIEGNSKDLANALKKTVKEKEKIQAEKDELRKEVERMRSGSGSSPTPKSSNYGFDLSKYEPRYMHDEEVEWRKIAIDEFRKERRESREKQERAWEMMEKVREWKLERNYPPSRRAWKATAEKTSWEMWNGDEWLEDETPNSGTAEEKIKVKKMLKENLIK